MAAIARFAPTAARVLLGLVFFVFGLNGFLGFLPQPEMNAPSAALMGAFVESGYLMTFIKVAEVLAGFLLLTNLFVPLALVVLAPITLNILAFHAVLAPPTVGMSIVLVALNAYLGYAHRGVFAPMLRAKVAPARPAAAPATKTAAAHA